MSFQCKECDKDITATQAKETYEEFGRAMCVECVNRMLNTEEETGRPEPEQATPSTTEEKPEIPASIECENRIDKSVVHVIDTDLPPICMDIVRPAVTAKQAMAAWQEFQALKKAVIDRTDIQVIQGKNFVKKSGWRKLAQYFNLSDDIIEEVREYVEGCFIWTIKVRCVAANGRYTIGVGKCASNEKKFAHLEHDTYATAHTRAKNRAISDMIAAGEVSAEEVQA